MSKPVVFMEIAVSPGPVRVRHCCVLSRCSDGLIVNVSCRSEYFFLASCLGSDGDHPFIELGADRDTNDYDRRFKKGTTTRITFVTLLSTRWSMVAASPIERNAVAVAFWAAGRSMR